MTIFDEVKFCVLCATFPIQPAIAVQREKSLLRSAFSVPTYFLTRPHILIPKRHAAREEGKYETKDPK